MIYQPVCTLSSITTIIIDTNDILLILFLCFIHVFIHLSDTYTHSSNSVELNDSNTVNKKINIHTNHQNNGIK